LTREEAESYEYNVDLAAHDTVDEQDEHDSDAGAEQDEKFMIFFVRPLEADGDVEVDSPQCARDSELPRLAKDAYGSLSTWHRMDQSTPRERTEEEAHIFEKENGVSWDNWYPMHVRYLKR